MKKTILTLTAILIASLSFAQGGGFNYKALITDNGNALANQSVSIKFTVLENGTTSVYQEIQTATTDANGIVAVNIGEGTTVSGNFTTIDWGGNPYFLKVEIDTGSGYQNFGTTEFKAVPYAKYAEKAGNVFSGDFGDLSNVPAGLSDGDDDTHLTDAQIAAMGYIKNANDADHDATNELQTISKNGNTITLSNGGGSVTDSDTHLTEAQVDAYVANNGYLTQVDNIQGIPVSSTTPANGQVLKYNGSQFVPADDDVSGGSGADGVVNAATFSGTTTKTLTLSRSNGLGNITANFTDNDTHLTDAQISAMGYIKNANDADHDATNEIQNLSINNNQLTISQGNTVTLPSGGATKLNDLSDARSDNDGTNNGSSVFIGVDAGANDDQSNNANVGIGYQVLKANINGAYNAAYGSKALYSNTSGTNNTASGALALFSNTSGNSNTASGNLALFSNISGNSNTASGYKTLYYNTTGYYNNASGNSSLFHNTTGNYNTASGYKALFFNSTGDYNTASGSKALYHNTTGKNNTASGYRALYSNSTGYSNVAIGRSALYKNIDRSNLVAVGDSALYHNGEGATGINSAIFNTALGSKALFSNTTGNDNVATGSQALYSNTTGNDNVATGSQALYSNTTGENNVATGSQALYSNTTGMFNTASGYSALFFNTSGKFNTAYGYLALLGNSTGEYNTAIGFGAFYTGNYQNSTALGANSTITADNMVKLGDNDVSWIGGHSSWHNTSDGRFKRNVTENIPGLDFIKRLRPVSYTWDLDGLDAFMGVKNKHKDPAERAAMEQVYHTGFIAQEVEAAAQACGFDFDGVHHPANDKDPYSLAYGEFVVPLVKAVQEQQEVIEQQKAKLIEQDTKLIGQQKKIEEQQNQLEQQKAKLQEQEKRLQALEKILLKNK